MPIYEYRCENGHNFEVMQRITDDPVASCTVCGASVQRVFHPVAVHFKGSGFYNTDYGTRRRAREQKEGAASEGGSSGGSDSGGSGAKSGASDSGASDSGGSGSKSGGSGAGGSGGSGSGASEKASAS